MRRVPGVGGFTAAFLLLAAPWAAAQQPADIDLAAVEQGVRDCRVTPADDELATRLGKYGVARAPRAMDDTTGLAVSKLIVPEYNPERAAEGIAALLAGHVDDAAFPAVVAYYVFKDMALYRSLNCTSVDAWYRHAVVYGDLRREAAADDPNLAYYGESEATALAKLAGALRAGRRIAEKEAALLQVLGLTGD